MEKRMTAETMPHKFNHFDSISIIGFLKNFKLACHTNGMHEGAAMWLFHFFINKTVSTVQNAVGIWGP